VNSSILLDIGQLRIGMYVQLDVNWLQHPFPVGSFRIASQEQIETLRALGLKEVRYVPEKSDVQWRDPDSARGSDTDQLEDAADAAFSEPTADATSPDPDPADEWRRRLIEEQNRSLAVCDQRFTEATRQYQAMERVVQDQPGQARVKVDALVDGCVSDVLEHGDSVIRLLSEGVGERSAQHPINVTVLSLLLGRALGMDAEALTDVGTAALIHDIGKIKLPSNLRYSRASMPSIERARYETHVAESVVLARAMGYPEPVLAAVARHHEMADGSGFPGRLSGSELGRMGQMLALVNLYDRMCNPANGVDALTPHEVLAVMFAQLKSRFDPVVLGAFIRIMGVYPPGSVVQLVNDRYAIVVSVNSSRPLRPKVIVHDPAVPKERALVLDLETVPELGIRRSLKPSQLPREALSYLSPRQRICYFFERAVPLGPQETD
jgi:putative nucleotidyltransferase with HDIG domain